MRAGGEPPALILRPWRVADIPALAAEMSHDYLLGGMWSGPGERPYRTVPRGGAERTGPMDERDAARWLASQDRGWRDGDRLCFAVLEANDAGACVLAGNVGLKNREETGRIGERETAEIGHWTAVRGRGRGVAPARPPPPADPLSARNLPNVRLVRPVADSGAPRPALREGAKAIGELTEGL